MGSLVTYVQTTAYDLTPPSLRLPPAIWEIFTGLNKVHNLWRWYRRAELYQQPDNLFQLFTGHLVNIAVRDSLLLRVAAQSLLVSTRLLECSQQQIRLKESARELVGALIGRYPKPVSIAWEKGMSYFGLSATTVYWWKTRGLSIYQRIQRIALLLSNVILESFLLSMKIMDVIDAFSWSPMIRNDAVNELFVNLTNSFENLVNNKEELLLGLTENQSTIEYLIKTTPFTYKQLLGAVENTLDTSQTIHQNMKKISNIGGETLLNIGKRMVGGGMVVIGLADYRPTILSA